MKGRHDTFGTAIRRFELVPDADRDSAARSKSWIRDGANIAPGSFAAFTVMGHRTRINPMVLSRSLSSAGSSRLPDRGT